jgi:hypothetical protein
VLDLGLLLSRRAMTAATRPLRPTVLVAASLALTGCVSWTPSPANPRDVVASNPAVIRVHRPDGTSAQITRPTIQNDSIAESTRGQTCRGAHAVPRRTRCSPTPAAVTGIVALQDVRGPVEVRRMHYGRTALVVVVTVPYLIGFILCSNLSGPCFD